MKQKIKDIRFKIIASSDLLYRASIKSFGIISVLNKKTIYDNGLRDVETGYADSEGGFWLASGMFDIREYPELSIPEAIELIKKNANTCYPNKCKNRTKIV